MRTAFCLTMLLVAGPARASTPSMPDAVAAEARAVLDGLLAVDTSHGNETAALRPVEKRLRDAGIETLVVESGPGHGNLIARIAANRPAKRKPLLLLAHVDVVPVEGQTWSSPPFAPTARGGYLVARGVEDDKSMASAIVAVALDLARTHRPLDRDVLVALTAGEETGGAIGVRWLVGKAGEPGAPALLAALRGVGVVLNEGGGILLTPDGKGVRSVSIGAAEKTYQSFVLTTHGRGGHSSMPGPASDTVTPLARALVRVGEYRFPSRVLPAAREALGQRATWEPNAQLAEALRRAAASAPHIAPADDAILSTEPSVNNLIRTTCVTTMLEAAPQDNVLPVTARATVNCRILPDETPDEVRRVLAGLVARDGVSVAYLDDEGHGPASPLDGEGPAAIRAVATRLWPGAAVYDSLGAGASDSRFLRAVGIPCYGTSVAPVTLAEIMAGHGAHGPDERRPMAWFEPGVRYLWEVVRTLTE